MKTRVIASLLAVLMLSALFPAGAGAAPSYTEYELYVERPAAEAGSNYYHGAKFEPKTGAYLGIYAEGDEKMHDWNVGTYSGWYFGQVPRYTGRQHAAYMLYVHYDEPDAISHYASHFKAAKELGKAIQICIEPTNGLDEVQNDAHLRALAEQANDAGIPLLIRFASEFNDSGNSWHKDGPEKYIEKFRIVADAFHACAPNAAMAWVPNDWPIGSEDAYYPGDEYVDWVGVASYPVFYESGAPKQANTWMDRFHLLYEKYGARKPIFISEGAPSATVESHPEQNVTDAAQYEIRRFYAGAARRYPNLKLIIYWSEDESWGRLIHCQLSNNAALMDAYKSAIADPYYLGDFNTSSGVYYQKVAETTMKPQAEKLSCYVNDVKTRVAKACYYIDDTYVGEGCFPDYTASVNFAPYAGKTVSLRADFYNEQDAYVTAKTLKVAVGGGAAAPAASSPSVTVGGKAVAWTDAAPFIDANNRTMVPLRAVGDALGLKVEWNDAKREASFTDGAKTLYFPIDSATAHTGGGEEIKMDTAAVIVNDRTYAPVRYLAEFFGHTVEWDGKTSTVVIK